MDSLSSGDFSSSESPNLLAGFVACAIAVVGFGSNFVPVKKIYSGNGIFFQWAMCIAIWLVGLSVYAYRKFTKFEPIAMLGGVLWCSGNVMAVPIINMVGMALGMSVWCVANMVTGWASGTIGLFGLKQQEVKNRTLNYIGAGVAAVSIVLFTCVKSSPSKKDEDSASSEEEGEANEPLMGKGNVQDEDSQQSEDGMSRCIKKMHPVLRRIIGLIMAVVSGVCYGLNFDPPQYVIDNIDGASDEVLDYVFPHFTGILAMSTLIVVVYCCITRNSPTVYRRSLLPGLLSGAIWAVAQVAWFVANKNLKFPVSFPIITSGPAVIATLWGVLLFHEVTGVKQIILLVIALVVTIVGVVLIALSSFI